MMLVPRRRRIVDLDARVEPAVSTALQSFGFIDPPPHADAELDLIDFEVAPKRSTPRALLRHRRLSVAERSARQDRRRA